MSLDHIITVCLTGGIFAFIEFLINRHDRRKSELYVKISDITPLKEALMAILQDRLEHLMRVYIEKGEISITQFKALQTMLKAYEGLDGDDFIHDLWAEVKLLPKK